MKENASTQTKTTKGRKVIEHFIETDHVCVNNYAMQGNLDGKGSAQGTRGPEIVGCICKIEAGSSARVHARATNGDGWASYKYIAHIVD